MEQKHDHREYPAYFMRNEAILVVEHDRTVSGHPVTPKHLRTWFQAVFQQPERQESPESSSESAVPSLKSSCDALGIDLGDFQLEQFPRLDLPLDISANDDEFAAILPITEGRPPTSLLFVKARQKFADFSDLLEDKRHDQEFNEHKQHDKELFDLLDNFNLNLSRRQNYALGRDFNVKVVAATPNWLFGAAPHQLIDGGPGGAPVPVSSTPAASNYQFNMPDVDLVLQSHVSAQGAGCNIDVVILDAAPSKEAYETALDTHLDNHLLQKTSHHLRIVRASTTPGSELQLELPADDSDHDDYYSHHADYEISDHGLFVAGTVHSIAPHANIYLLEILNRFGVGSVTTLVRGIESIAAIVRKGINCDQPQGYQPNTLVVNLSLCISFRDLQELAKIHAEHTPNNLLSQGGTTAEDYLKLLLTAIDSAMFTLQGALPGTTIHFVAAAGNDGYRDHDANPATPDTLTPPRYPAAMDAVLGVGALDDEGKRTRYSNQADNPVSKGIMVFGGALDAVNRTLSNQNGGMLGLYIGKFPDGTVSQNGWARWSGTSFATGVMSGILAKAAYSCGDGNAVASTTPADILSLLTANAASTSENEFVLKVTQG